MLNKFNLIAKLRVWRHQLKGWWCRNTHSQSCKRFTLPTPHPMGQQFRINCALCHYQYTVVTPVDWSSPWNPAGRISSDKREHPVHEHNGKWWYWDADHMFREGPFEDRTRAYAAFYSYYTHILKEGSDPEAYKDRPEDDANGAFWASRGLEPSVKSG